MTTVSTGMRGTINSNTPTLAFCVRITIRRKGVLTSKIFGYTSFAKDIDFQGVTYRATDGAGLSALDFSRNLAVDNAEIQAAIVNSEDITKRDVRAGKLDDVEFFYFFLDYTNLANGQVILQRGDLGDITIGSITVSIETRSLAERMRQVFGEIISPVCRADVFDNDNPRVLRRCPALRATFLVTGSISGLLDNRIVFDNTLTEPTGWFSDGVMTVLTGENADLDFKIKTFTSPGRFELVEGAVYPFAIGDTFEATPGCDGFISTHVTKFGLEARTFKGHPHIPGDQAQWGSP